MSIQKEGQKINSLSSDEEQSNLLYWICVVSVCLLILAGLFFEGKSKASVSILMSQDQALIAADTAGYSGKIIASSKNSTYFYPWCRGAKTVKAEHRQVFSDKTAAKRAGFTPSKQCAGLVAK